MQPDPLYLQGDLFPRKITALSNQRFSKGQWFGFVGLLLGWLCVTVLECYLEWECVKELICLPHRKWEHLLHRTIRY